MIGAAGRVGEGGGRIAGAGGFVGLDGNAGVGVVILAPSGGDGPDRMISADDCGKLVSGRICFAPMSAEGCSPGMGDLRITGDCGADRMDGEVSSVDSSGIVFENGVNDDGASCILAASASAP